MSVWDQQDYFKKHIDEIVSIAGDRSTTPNKSKDISTCLRAWMDNLIRTRFMGIATIHYRWEMSDMLRVYWQNQHGGCTFSWAYVFWDWGIEEPKDNYVDAYDRAMGILG